MKNRIFTLILILTVTATGFAQKKPKIKGNRQVVTKVYTLKPFHSIVAGENLHIKLKPATETEALELRADENLHEALEWKVSEGILYLETTYDIIKRRAFDITVFVEKDIKYIHLSQYADMETENKIKLESSVRLELQDYAKADLQLDIKDSLKIDLKNKAELNLDAESQTTEIHITDDATLKGYLGTGFLLVTGDKKSDMILGGFAKKMDMKLSDKAEFSGKKFKIKKEAVVRLDNRGKASLEGQSAKIRIFLTDKSHLHVKGSFKNYQLEKFEGESVLSREP